MRSLRSRLILGTAFVAVVPLAIAIFLLSQRIGATVHRDAAVRLDSSLRSIVTNLENERRRMDAKLRILARDPTLRRLYLVQGGERERAEYLAERRVLLGLDYLDTDSIVDPTGPVVLQSMAPILYDGRPVGTLRGGLRLDAAYLGRLEQSSGVDLLLRDPAGRVAASTTSAAGPDTLSGSAPLTSVTPRGASITAVLDTAAADRAIREFQIVAALLGLLGLALAVALASAWSAQVSRPVERLATFSRKLARGEWDESLELHSVEELETLVAALETMRTDLTTYRERLVTTERQAAWSLMARKVAHEVKNPLTPIAVSIADLKRTYEQGRADFPAVLDQAVRTISEEVASLKRLLNEFSEFARLPAPRFAPCTAADIVQELGAIYAGDVTEGRLLVDPPRHAAPLRADADQIRQVLINLIQNGLEATGGRGPVTVGAHSNDGWVEFSVSDTGPGLTDEEKANLFVPGFTTKKTGSGLGLTIAQRIAHDHGGTIRVESTPGRGTTMMVRIPAGRGD